MTDVHFTYQSYSWSLGTTSFRMADFHRKVEEQLILLNDFWNQDENKNLRWAKNTKIQEAYYEFAYDKGFITGDILNDSAKKAKTARQKTSGLVDIGLIDDNRKLTEVGAKLLKMALEDDFQCDNAFQIPADSYLYLKQLLKTANPTQDGYVRPYLVTGKVIQESDGYLTDDEFTYLLPLCVNEDITEEIIEDIKLLRMGEKQIDQIIIEVVLDKYDYPAARNYLIRSAKTPTDIMTIGMNRDGIRHDAIYADLYAALKKVYLENDSIDTLVKVAKSIKNKPGTLWRGLLFENIRRINNRSDLKYTDFENVENEEQFARVFFAYLHLIKIKATLGDYKDLNRRYLKITDTFIFEDGKITFTPLFENFFKTDAKNVFEDAFKDCHTLTRDCEITEINSSLTFNKTNIVAAFNDTENTSLTTIDEVYDYVENDRYRRFRHLIDTKFPNKTIIDILQKCETRDKDNELISQFGGEADVPTIFEYIVAVAWYRQSNYVGKILDYMNLQLDTELLPRMHAGGGESDIVYKYEDTPDYKAHDLLIECTLMEGTTQRRGEMEPVSRHLANHKIYENPVSYCTFVANNLHPSTISDFRSRKNAMYYINDTDYVDEMKIIPLHTRELRSILEKDIRYPQLYKIFDEAFNDTTIIAPPDWYNGCVKAEIDVI